MNRLGHGLGVALTFVGVLVLAGELQGAKRVRGGDTYSSKTKLFDVTVPRGCSAFVTPYEVQEANRKGDEFFEEVVFYMKDMGEVYHVGIRRLTPELGEKVKRSEEPLTPPQLSWLGVFLHLGPREHLTGTWKPLSAPEEVPTKHGAGVLSVNSVEGGRLLSMLKFEDGKMVPESSSPATVVVFMIQNGEHLIYVTGQADAGDMLGGAPEPNCVQTRLREMLDSLTITRPLK